MMENITNPLAIRDRRPLYIQAIEAITERIKSGELEPGSQLPPEEVLASSLGISRSTLREALGHLETHGLIARRQGIGTFVTIPSGSGFFGGLERLEPFSYLAEAAGEKHSPVSKTVSTVDANQEIASILNTNPGANLVRIQTIEAIDDIRCMYFDDYFINTNGLEKTLEDYTGSVLTYMFEEFHSPLSHTRSEILAIAADEDIAAKLDIPVGKPVFNMVETYFAADGKIIGVGYIYFVTDRFRFYITRRAVQRRTP
jgi:DNA-binding GntR family transcriptional regulator